MADYPIALAGSFASPYSVKMRAVLRYRQIPFRWVPRNSRWDDLPDVAVNIIPVLAFPDEDGNYRTTMVDSSPQITRLESEYTARSLVPPDPALAFIDFLVEDFVDEWVTKMMYHYRWTYEPDISKAGRLLPLDRNLQVPDAELQQASDLIIKRQVSRRSLVGSTENNQSIIEDSYRRLLDLLQEHLGAHHFMFGERPGRTDFALYGQLKPMLWWDPTPAAIGVERAPRAVNWIERVDDLSWWMVDGNAGWWGIDQLPSSVHDLLAEVGRTYVPFMLANNTALGVGAEEMVCLIDGQEYRQAPFGYQGKCLRWVRDAYATLDSDDRSRVDTLFAGTGCELLFEPDHQRSL